jgi:3-oxoacyl-[acyl-carrier-protein] synthase-1
MMTGVGLNAPSSCAAIRVGISNFVETRFIDSAGEWIVGSYVPLDQPWRGRAKLAHLAASVIKECLSTVETASTEAIPLFLCVAEQNRPGRLTGLDDQLLDEVQAELGLRFHESSEVISQGRVGGILAARQATEIMYQDRLQYCIIAGVDTFLVAGALTAYEERERILTGQNSNGFIPGEAGAAVLLCTGRRTTDPEMAILGIGFGNETATIDSEEPLRADGLVQAIKEALADSGLTMADVDYRIADLSGEQYGFKEASLALIRILRERKDEFDIWHPADCIGEVGTAIVPCVIGVAKAAAQKGYAPGNRVLCHFGNDEGERAAIVLSCS